MNNLSCLVHRCLEALDARGLAIGYVGWPTVSTTWRLQMLAFQMCIAHQKQKQPVPLGMSHPYTGHLACHRVAGENKPQRIVGHISDLVVFVKYTLHVHTLLVWDVL